MRVRFIQDHKVKQGDGKGPHYRAGEVHEFSGPVARTYALKYIRLGLAEEHVAAVAAAPAPEPEAPNPAVKDPEPDPQPETPTPQVDGDGSGDPAPEPEAASATKGGRKPRR